MKVGVRCSIVRGITASLSSLENDVIQFLLIFGILEIC